MCALQRIHLVLANWVCWPMIVAWFSNSGIFVDGCFGEYGYGINVRDCFRSVKVRNEGKLRDKHWEALGILIL
jgi:hypothetical protein